MNDRAKRSHSRCGFTLLEVLVSTAMCAVILLAVNSLLHSAMRLRDRAEDTIQKKAPVQYALNVIQQDLANIVPPDGDIAGSTIGENEGSVKQPKDRIEFYSSTGRLYEGAPYGDVQRIEYFLIATENSNQAAPFCLVRTVARNLLSSVEIEPDCEVLLNDVRSLEILYFDGESWQGTWDSTAEDTPLPLAIQIRIFYAPLSKKERNESNRKLVLDRQEYGVFEAIVPIPVTPYEESEESTGESQNQSGGDESNQIQSGGTQNTPGGNQGPSAGDPGQGGRPS